ncbi:heme transporter [Gordonia sp. FQ]|uniref:heme transporter n=1 Tax=Gordonia sp. FQ TaxID=3446634 RepID=UPI003F82F766
MNGQQPEDRSRPDDCPCRRCPRARGRGTDLEQVLDAPGSASTLLDGPVDIVLSALPLLDEVVGVTAAGPVLTSATGAHAAPIGAGGPLLAPAGTIALRVRPAALGPMVITEPVDRTPPTLRFFDRDGTIAHAVYLTRGSDRLVFESLSLVGPSVGGGGLAGVHLGEGPSTPGDSGDQLAMLDDVLADRGCRRGAALASGTQAGAVRVASSQLVAALTHAARLSMPITTCAVAPGILAIHHDRLDGVREHAGVMVMASGGTSTMIDFNDIEHCWLTRADGSRGRTSAVELYDRHGRCCFLASVTGPITESTWAGWEQLIDDLRDHS